MGSNFSPFFIFTISRKQQYEHCTVNAKSWFYDMRNYFFCAFFVNIIKFMVFQIKIRSISETEKFFSAERIIKFKIHRSFGIMGAIFIRDLKFMNFSHIYTYFFYPFKHFTFPIFKIFFPIFLASKIFYFHLFKLPLTKKKIPRSYLIAKCFTDLSHAKRKLGMKSIYGIFKIHKHTLCRFGP